MTEAEAVATQFRARLQAVGLGRSAHVDVLHSLGVVKVSLWDETGDGRLESFRRDVLRWAVREGYDVMDSSAQKMSVLVA